MPTLRHRPPVPQEQRVPWRGQIKIQGAEKDIFYKALYLFGEIANQVGIKKRTNAEGTDLIQGQLVFSGCRTDHGTVCRREHPSFNQHEVLGSTESHFVEGAGDGLCCHSLGWVEGSNIGDDIC